MKLLKHQKDYLENRNLDKDLLAHEGGTGKTIIAVEWLKIRDTSNALVLCPKRIKLKWKEALGGLQATIMSSEEFKKQGFNNPTAIIVDEADEWASPLFIPKLRSQRTDKLYNLVKNNPDTPILLLTATPIRSTPNNLHTLLCFLSIYIPYKDWRNKFFTLENRPYLPRPAWLLKENWRTLIRPVLEKYAHIVLLKDCVDKELPAVRTEIINLKNTFSPIKNEEWSPMRCFVEEHKAEQIGKVVKIKEISKEYRKVVVIAHYREQCLELFENLKKERETFLVYGGIKNQEEIIKQAQESSECYLIIQASLSAGYDLDTFSCSIFASMSYKFVDWKQQTYRMRRIHNLHPVIYYYLLGGRRDKQIYDTVMLGKDFSPEYYYDVA